jgi:hypothetical protein
MSAEQTGWRGLAADLIAADQATSQPIQHPDRPAPATSDSERDGERSARSGVVDGTARPSQQLYGDQLGPFNWTRLGCSF